MSSNKDIHSHISEYLESQRKDYLNDTFGYSSYTSPNTMFSISNDLPTIMLKLSLPALRVWLRCLELIKRNHDPVIACTIIVKKELFADLVGRTLYYKSIKELCLVSLLKPTLKKSIYIVSINKANKLFKPKLEI